MEFKGDIMYKYNPVQDEKQILKFWKDNKIREKAVNKNQGKKPFYFLQ